MKLISIGTVLVAFALFQVFLQVKTQRQIESRRVRTSEEKCDPHSSRCNFRDEEVIKEKDHDFKAESDKKRPPILTRDDFPSSGGGRTGISSDNQPEPVGDRPGNDPESVRGGDGYVPEPTHEPSINSHKPDSIPPDDDYFTKPTIDKDFLFRHGGGSHNSKPPVVRDELRPVRGSGNRGGYNPKPPIARDELRPARGSDDGGGGYTPKPPVVRDESRPVRGSSGRGEYNPKAIRGGVGGGSYNSKPIVNRDEYDPKPITNRDDFNPKPIVTRDDGGGGYFPGSVDDDYYNPRPVEDGGGGYDKDEEIRDDSPGRKHEPAVERNCKLCVPFYQCQDGHIVTDGSRVIDRRSHIRHSEDSEEFERYLDGKLKPRTCGSHHICCEVPETSTVQPYHHSCGVKNPSEINRRILPPSNEGEADFGEWPWQAAVLKAEGKVNIFQCGGVLIDKLHVLTVAHCVFHLYKNNDYPLKVRLGEWDTQTQSEFLAHQDYRVSKIIIHPDYKNSSLWNDIALLRLEEQVAFAPHIASICLPQYDEIFAGQNCIVTGWGKNAYMGGTFSNVLKEVALQVVEDYNCEEMLRKTRLGQFFQLYEGFLCAGGEYGLDSCKGDGGGPLMCLRKDKTYTLAGLVSWGIDCGQPGVPGVYTKVQKYLDWISKNTGFSLQEYRTVLNI